MMEEHPCAKGLSPACFKEHPKWARKALAYKLLMMMIPPELSAKLPGNLLKLGPGAPPGWPAGVDPPGFISAPVSVPPAVRSGGFAASSFTAPFSAGPVHPPAPAPSTKEYTTEFLCTGTEYLLKVGSPWLTVRNVSSGASVELVIIAYRPITSNDMGGFYVISRLNYKFDLSALPAAAEMVSGYVSLKVYSKTAGTGVSIQRAPGSLWNNVLDYLAFEGDADDHLAIVGTEQILDLGADSLAYCKSAAGGDAFFMAREYDHDYLNVAPVGGSTFEGYIYSHVAVLETSRPTLVLTYKA